MSRPSLRRRAFQLRWLQAVAVTVAVVALFLLAASSAVASLGLFYSDVGPLHLSVDGMGTLGDTGIIQVDKPAGAQVKKAYLFSAGTGFTGYTPADGDVTLDDLPVTWDPAYTIPNGIGSGNVAADVTNLVANKVNVSAPGRVTFTIGERNSGRIDGEILAVVFDDPSSKVRSIFLLYGAQNTTGDHFALGLTDPLLPSSVATMGLGISYGYQTPGGTGQYSQVKVNETQITSSAGGQGRRRRRQRCADHRRRSRRLTGKSRGSVRHRRLRPWLAVRRRAIRPQAVRALRCDVGRCRHA